MKPVMLVVFDTETTGLSHINDDVVQLAALFHEEGSENVDAYMEFCKPTAPMGEKAQATHGITLEQLHNCRPSMEIAEEFDAYLQGFEQDYELVFAGQNLAFDIRMMSKYLDRTFNPVADSYRLARRLAKGASNHKLEYLYREFYGLASDNTEKAHDALSDVWMVLELLWHFQKETKKGYKELANLTDSPILLENFPFGKYKGLPIRSGDKGYMRYMLTLKDLDRDLRYSMQLALGMR